MRRKPAGQSRPPLCDGRPARDRAADRAGPLLRWCCRASLGAGDPDGTAAVVDVAGVSMRWPGSSDVLCRISRSTLGGAGLPAHHGFRTLAGRGHRPGRHLRAQSRARGLCRRDRPRHQAPPRLDPRERPSAPQPALRIADMSKHYASLPVPIEIVHGADIVVPPTIHSFPLSQLVPGPNLIMLPGVGHMPHHVAPEEVVAAIERARASAGL